MDQHKLRNVVFEKTGVRIDVDDPVFALVALNEAVLEEAVERHIKLLHDASAQIAGLPARGGAGTESVVIQRQHPAVLGGAAMLGALLVLLGQVLFFRPVPERVLVPAVLSAEQTASVRNAEKLTAVIDRLDKRTRATIAAEMAKD